ncbi:uncharacterized protein [Leptinotarsa decemlineata]|uniref:uncharacterized protein n=1 Tax=Leptinotarsa decemlineata TaxID=7539 RepID=UPI003D306CAC
MESASSEEEIECKPPSARKRPKHGRLKEVSKKINLQSREAGEPCKCKDKCFEAITERERAEVLRHINSLKSHDEVNLYLTGLVTILPVQRHRMKNELDAKFKDATYCYAVRVMRNNTAQEFKVCKNAFISIHGISRGKIDYILNQMKKTGTPPKYNKGKHENRPHKLSDETLDAIRSHIKSFKGRESHYSQKDSKKTYLPDDLNVSKMFKLFQDCHPNIRCSLESYRTIFNKEFNISFGYPRTDTCSSCDKYAVQKKFLEKQFAEEKDEEKKQNLSRDIHKMDIEHEVHLTNAQVFYDRKKAARKASRKSPHKEAICMDYAKNYPCPNIATNDVYYKRQLSVYAFNIHVMSDSRSLFYIYPQTIASKGSDEVASFFHDFIYNHLDKKVRHLQIFSDSCAGQNKNKTILRLMHHVVHVENRLDYIKMTFPIRGHSYLECDKNTALVKHTAHAETPQDWVTVFQNARCKPSPFTVVEVDQEMVKDWSSFLDEKYKSKKLPCKSREIREFEVLKEHPALIRNRQKFNGPWYETPVLPKLKKNKEKNLPPEEVKRRFTEWQRGNLSNGEFHLPDPVYGGLIPIDKAKYEDIQHLKEFCRPEAAVYFSQLSHT